MEWVRKRYGKENSEEYFFVSDGILRDYEELAVMYQCKHNIMANSTFSFWGAWLNDNQDKIVIIPRVYASTFAPDEWIKCRTKEILDTEEKSGWIVGTIWYWTDMGM